VADVLFSQGKKVVEVLKVLVVTDITYYGWRLESGGYLGEWQFNIYLSPTGLPFPAPKKKPASPILGGI